MISDPYDHEHPLLVGQRDYRLVRGSFDTGDESTEASAVLHFRHQDGSLRVLRFWGVHLTLGIGALAEIRGYLPVYVADVGGRGWEPGIAVEVGDTDPGHAWFWAAGVVVEADQGVTPDDGA